MAAVWEQRFSGFLKRVLDLKESTALELLPDAMPVLPVLDPSAAELLLARGEAAWAGYAVSPAVAARLSVVRLYPPTPVDASCLIIVDEIAVSTNSLIGFTFTGLLNDAAVATRQALDRRPAIDATLPLVSRASLGTADGLSVNFIDRCWYVVVPEARVWRPGIVLGPGQNLFIAGDTVNTALTCSLKWRERVVGGAEAAQR